MNLDDLKKRIGDLTTRLENINQWIMEKPCSDPNLYEMTECLMDFGNLTDLWNYYVILNDTSSYCPKEIIHDPNLEKLIIEVCKMMKLRGVMPLDEGEEYKGFSIIDTEFGFKIVDSPFFQENEEAACLIRNIYDLSINGNYIGERILGIKGFNEKKSFFTSVAGVSCYIWQQRQYNAEYKYDDKEEFCMMKKNYKRFRNILKEANIYFYEGEDAINKMYNNIEESFRLINVVLGVFTK